MKKTAIAIALAATVTIAPLSASAQSSYFELGYSHFEESWEDISIAIPVILVTAGYSFTEHFSFEGYVGTGISDDTVTYEGIDIDLKFDSIVGFNLKGSVSFSENVAGFAKAGLAAVKTTASASGFGSISDTTSALTFSGGLEYNFTPSVYGTISYTYYNTDADSDSVNFGVGMRF